MKTTMLMLIASTMLQGQQTRREIVNAAPTPAEDAKPNSDKVPDAYAITGHFDRVVVLRFKYQTDLLAGIEKMVQDR